MKSPINAAIKIAGNIDMVLSASCALASSINFPIIGNTIDTDSIPKPPIIDKPKAPVSGKYSATNPNMVGQKKVTPTAKTAAAAKIIPPEVMVSNHNPIKVKMAENNNIPDGLNL